MALRCFIAIAIPESLRSRVGEITESLKRAGADVRWVAPQNVHLTIKFLGPTDEGLVDVIKDSLLKKLSTSVPFYITIGGVGFFPERRTPRVIWVGIEDSGALGALHKDIDSEMTRLGFDPETRSFSPHLTIGRVKSPRKVPEMIGVLDTLRATEIGKMEIGEVILMKSELKPAGAEHQRLAVIPFGGRNNVKQG